MSLIKRQRYMTHYSQEPRKSDLLVCIPYTYNPSVTNRMRTFCNVKLQKMLDKILSPFLKNELLRSIIQLKYINKNRIVHYVSGLFLVRVFPPSDCIRTRKTPNMDTFHRVVLRSLSNIHDGAYLWK